jgi:hypothetical protein
MHSYWSLCTFVAVTLSSTRKTPAKTLALSPGRPDGPMVPLGRPVLPSRQLQAHEPRRLAAQRLDLPLDLVQLVPHDAERRTLHR